MSISVEIPTPLRRFTDNQGRVEVDATSAATVSGVLERLVTAHPSLRRHLYGDDGKLRSFVNVFVGDDDVRHLDGQDTAVDDGATVSIIPSIAGGAR